MKKILIIFSLAALLAGCEKSYDAPAPKGTATDEDFVSGIVANFTSIAALKGMYVPMVAGQSMATVGHNVVVKGVVVSSDQEGNLYRSLYIVDGTGGIEVRIGKPGLYLSYPIGMTLYVNVRELALGKYGGSISIGLPDRPTSNNENTWIDAAPVIARTVFCGGQLAATDPLLQPVEIASTAALTDANVGRLATVKNVYFKRQSGLSTWAKPAAGNVAAAYGEHWLGFSSGAQDVMVRTSGYSSFAGKECPNTGNMLTEITGILTKFNSTWQLVLNTDRDVKPQP
ncbi:MAG: DUF5689 domain-containing protein [Rikenellaceae bacterium]|nr:DUF5689 domain-containing protein [Rikenellaceae bacterium]